MYFAELPMRRLSGSRHGLEKDWMVIAQISDTHIMEKSSDHAVAAARARYPAADLSIGRIGELLRRDLTSLQSR